MPGGNATGYKVEDELDARVMDTAVAFLAACADHLRLNRCDPSKPTHADLIDEANFHFWTWSRRNRSSTDGCGEA